MNRPIRTAIKNRIGILQQQQAFIVARRNELLETLGIVRKDIKSRGEEIFELEQELKKTYNYDGIA